MTKDEKLNISPLKPHRDRHESISKAIRGQYESKNKTFLIIHPPILANLQHTRNMKQTTKKRHERIRQAAGELYGKMPVMRIYTELADQFDLSDEHIRRILRKKHTP